jgi:hypothetical protein
VYIAFSERRRRRRRRRWSKGAMASPELEEWSCCPVTPVQDLGGEGEDE